MTAPPKTLELKKPVGQAVPLLVDSPHSGTLLPPDFDFVCSLADLRASDEFYVDQLGASCVAQGGTFLKALVSRAYIDLNRAIGEIPPSLCETNIPWPLLRSKRVTYGIGLIRHLVRPNAPVYARKLSLEDIQRRIRHYYDPYYQTLGDNLRGLRDRFGRVCHVNLHAMPSIGADGKMMPDIVLGDHDGHSSARLYRETLKAAFEKHGLKVMINDPYKGAELTKHFAKPRQGIHSIQIEINKALYMDEDTLAATADLQTLRRVFDDVWSTLADVLHEQAMPKAAE